MSRRTLILVAIDPSDRCALVDRNGGSGSKPTGVLRRFKKW
jgi:hypothetical protein